MASSPAAFIQVFAIVAFAVFPQRALKSGERAVRASVLSVQVRR